MRAFYLVSILGFSLYGCAQRVDELEQRVSDLDERARVLENRSGVPVGSDRELLEGRRLADVRTQMATMKNDVTVLSGKVEALEFELKTAKDRIEQLSRDSEMAQRNLQSQQHSAPTSTSAPIAATGDDKYRQALALHQTGDFSQSRARFEEFLKESPRSPLADNAIFWIGESYMIEKDYKKALVRFDDLIAKFPDSDKRCDARDRQVEALKSLGMTEQAKVFGDLRTEECRKH